MITILSMLEVGYESTYEQGVVELGETIQFGNKKNVSEI